MDTQFQSVLNRIQADIASNAKTWIPTPRKFDVESVTSAVIVIAGFYLASLLFKKVAEKFFLANKFDESLTRFLVRGVRITLVSLGVVTALGTLGVDVSAIVAGLGLTGLALGIALKDIVSNAVSGIMLLLFRPFKHRDKIRLNDFEGEVIDIDLRYTHLSSSGGEVIFVPNSMMFANAVTVQRRAKATANDPLPTNAPADTNGAAVLKITEPDAPRVSRKGKLILSILDDDGPVFSSPPEPENEAVAAAA